jgi:hypothetical protein
VQRGEVVEEHTMDEDIAAADFAEEDALGGVVEEGDETKGATPVRAMSRRRV